MLIAALFAGQHTSSVTSTWTGMRMSTNPDWYRKCVKEQEEIVKKHGTELSVEILQEMTNLHVTIKETLRLHPPLILLMRLAKEPFDVTDRDGRTYTIPKGDVCVASPSFQHRLEHVFDNPETYDPDRFLGERGKELADKGFSYIGFGAGRHGCMGEAFAYLQIKTIWSVILRQFDFELVGKLPEPDYEAMVVRARCIVFPPPRFWSRAASGGAPLAAREGGNGGACADVLGFCSLLCPLADLPEGGLQGALQAPRAPRDQGLSGRVRRGRRFARQQQRSALLAAAGCCCGGGDAQRNQSR